MIKILVIFIFCFTYTLFSFENYPIDLDKKAKYEKLMEEKLKNIIEQKRITFQKKLETELLRYRDELLSENLEQFVIEERVSKRREKLKQEFYFQLEIFKERFKRKFYEKLEEKLINEDIKTVYNIKKNINSYEIIDAEREKQKKKRYLVNRKLIFLNRILNKRLENNLEFINREILDSDRYNRTVYQDVILKSRIEDSNKDNSF